MEKPAYVILSVILAIALVAVVVVFAVLPALNPPPEVQSLNINAVDYSFGGVGQQPTFRVQAGKIIYLVLTNDGNVPHEIVLVQDKDMVLNHVHMLITNIQNDANYTTDEEREEAYEAAHEETAHAYRDIEAHVGVGETARLAFILDAGTYYFVCHEPDGTWPNVHQDAGMWATLIVEA